MNKLARYAVTGALVGAVTVGTLTWAGNDKLLGEGATSVKSQFDQLHTWYDNALKNLGQYKLALDKANGYLTSYKEKDETLLAKIKEYESKIAELNATIEQLKQEGGSNSETIAQLRQQIEELEAAKSELQSQLDAANSDKSTLQKEVTRLEGELTKANNDADTLQNHVNEVMGNTTATNDLVNADDLTGKENLKLYLTYTWVDSTGDRHEAANLDAVLGGYNDLDAYRESPIKLYYAGNQQMDIDGDYSYTNIVFINNTNAFNKIAKHSSSWKDVTDTIQLDGEKKIYNKDLKTVISLVNNTKWKAATGLETDNGTK